MLRRAALQAKITRAEQVFDAAVQLAQHPDPGNTARSTPIMLFRHEWVAAGESAYRSLEQGTSTPIDLGMNIVAIRMHARTTGAMGRALSTVEAIAGVTWDASGHPTLPPRPTTREAAIGLADLLLEAGERQRGERLLDEILSRMRDELERQGRPVMWYWRWYPLALALAGHRDDAVAMLQRGVAANGLAFDAWFSFDVEPGYDPLRADPRFVEMVRTVHGRLLEQRREVARLRASGAIPDRHAEDGGEPAATRTAGLRP